MTELLERERALETLRALHGQALQRSGRIALLAGEAGIGKSALVERFTAECGATRVLVGACDALFSPRPLGPLFDIARRTGGELAALLDSDGDRSAIFSATLRELGRTPTVAVFEDLHWADEATLDLLKFITRRIQHTPVLLIATYRDDELGPHHPLRSVLGALATSPASYRIALAPLSSDAVRRLAGADVDAEALYRRTGGNPFFVTEVLAGGGGIPPTVRDAVLARVARLSPPAREILDLAAAIGVRIEPFLLAGISSDMQAAGECLASGVLKAQGELLAFRHELARQTIWEAIPPYRRVVLHRLVLSALRSSPLARSDPSRLAYHADAAGDGAAVLEYASDAARQADLRGAHREAATMLGLALRYAAHLPAEQQAQLLERYAVHASRIDSRDEAIAARREAIGLWRAAGNRPREGENHAALVIMLIGVGRIAEAEQASRAAIELFEAHGAARQLAQGYESQAALRLFSSEYAAARSWCERILALPELAQHGYIWRRARMRRAVVGMYDDYQGACAELEQMVEEARRAARGDFAQEAELANLLANLGWRSTSLFQLRRAERYLAEGLAYTAERDLDTLRHLMLAASALLSLYRGEWHAVERPAREVVERPGASLISRIPALEALGRLRARRGDAGGLASLDLALDLALPTGYIQLIGPLRAARAEAAWVAGDGERALHEARAAYDLAVARQQPWIAGELALWRRRAGDTLEPPPWIAEPYRLMLAGDWRTAAGVWQELGCPFEQALALSAGDDKAVITALAIWDQLGAQPAADALRARLRTAGVQGVPRGPRPATRDNRFGLTERQSQILALLGEDLTNAEIAARLHLSAKTVDHHVSAVLSKLAVRSRRDAGVLARSQYRDLPAST